MTQDVPRPHLLASLLALLITSAALTFGYDWCRNVERQHVADLTSDLSDPKLHGVAIQREAFKRDDLLMLYGSSELVKIHGARSVAGTSAEGGDGRERKAGEGDDRPAEAARGLMGSKTTVGNHAGDSI